MRKYTYHSMHDNCRKTVALEREKIIELYDEYITLPETFKNRFNIHSVRDYILLTLAYNC